LLDWGDYVPARPKDAAACGLIDFEAFKTLASHHNFPWDFPSLEVAISVVTIFLLLEERGSKEALCAAQAKGEGLSQSRNGSKLPHPVFSHKAEKRSTFIGESPRRRLVHGPHQRG
jgi:hypothetical protein